MDYLLHALIQLFSRSLTHSVTNSRIHSFPHVYVLSFRCLPPMERLPLPRIAGGAWHTVVRKPTVSELVSQLTFL